MKTINRKGKFLKLAVLCLAAFSISTALPSVGQPLPRIQQKLEQKRSLSLSLGPANLSETRQSTQVAPGVIRTLIVRGQPSNDDGYTVDVAFRATREAAQAIAKSAACESDIRCYRRTTNRRCDRHSALASSGAGQLQC